MALGTRYTSAASAVIVSSMLAGWLVSRWRLTRAAAGLAIAFYVLHGIAQLVWLRQNAYFIDFEGFYHAAQALNAGKDPYAPFLRICPQIIGNRLCPGGSNLYPPLLSEAFRGLALPPEDTAIRIWLLVIHGTVVANVFIIERIVGRWLSMSAKWLLLASAFGFMPLHQNIYFLHMNLLLVLVLALAAWTYIGDEIETETAGQRQVLLAGFLCGLAAVLRVMLVLMAGALYRGRLPRLALAAMATTAAGVLGALALLPPYTVEYFTRVLPRLSTGTEMVQNQSLTGLVLRFQFIAAGHVLPWFSAGTTALGVLLLVLAIVVSRGNGGRAIEPSCLRPSSRSVRLFRVSPGIYTW